MIKIKEMTLSQQLLHKALAYAGTPSELARELNRSRSTIECWIKRNSKISYEDGLLLQEAIKRMRRRIVAQKAYLKKLDEDLKL